MEGFARASCVGGPRAGVEHWRRAAPHHPLPLRPCSKTLDGHKKGGAASNAPRGKCMRVFPPPRAPGRGPPHRPRMQRRRGDLAWLGSGVGKAGAGRPRRARARARPCSTPGLSLDTPKKESEISRVGCLFFCSSSRGRLRGRPRPRRARVTFYKLSPTHRSRRTHTGAGRTHHHHPHTGQRGGEVLSVKAKKRKTRALARRVVLLLFLLFHARARTPPTSRKFSTHRCQLFFVLCVVGVSRRVR